MKHEYINFINLTPNYSKFKIPLIIFKIYTTVTYEYLRIIAPLLLI